MISVNCVENKDEYSKHEESEDSPLNDLALLMVFVRKNHTQ